MRIEYIGFTVKWTTAMIIKEVRRKKMEGGYIDAALPFLILKYYDGD